MRLHPVDRIIYPGKGKGRKEERKKERKKERKTARKTDRQKIAGLEARKSKKENPRGGMGAANPRYYVCVCELGTFSASVANLPWVPGAWTG